MITGTRLRGGSANTARGAASFAAEAIGAARSCGCTGTIVARADSGFYNAAFIAACRRSGAYFSVTARMDPAVRAAIAAIPEDAWTAIRYPRAIWDGQLRRWVSDAQVAQAEYIAFASRQGQAVTARLIVRRVKDSTGRPGKARTSCSRSGAITPSSPTRRSPWCRLRSITAATPWSGRSSPTGPAARWLTCRQDRLPRTPRGLTCAAITCNLLRAAGCLASRFHAKARGATIRADLIDVAARLARRGRSQLILHLPQYWHRESEWRALFEAACGPPARAA